MTTAHTYHPPRLLDTAPLEARYEFMTQAILAFITAGHMGLVLRYSQKLLRIIRVHNRLTGANLLVRRKRDMLHKGAWRRRVLWGLGGREKLRRWDEFNARFMPRLETKSATSLNGYGPVPDNPSWLKTPERMAESERLKAHARSIMRANVNPNVTRDRVKMDFDGLFRLPPLPRKERLESNIKIYTQNTISEYDWNPIPFAEEKGFGPAMVWPQEFYAAMVRDEEMTAEEVPNYNSVIPAKERSDAEPGPNSKDDAWGWVPAQGRDDRSEGMDDRGEKLDDKLETESVPTIPLHLALDAKTYRALFENPV